MYLLSRACSVAGGGSAAQRGSAQQRGFSGHDAYNQTMPDEIRNLQNRSHNMSKRRQKLELRKLQLKYRTLLSTGALQIAPCK